MVAANVDVGGPVARVLVQGAVDVARVVWVQAGVVPCGDVVPDAGGAALVGKARVGEVPPVCVAANAVSEVVDAGPVRLHALRGADVRVDLRVGWRAAPAGLWEVAQEALALNDFAAGA